jgi:glycosyltransferase involved in cell wall biosynthesis
MKKIILVANTSWSMIKFRHGIMRAFVEHGCEVFVLAPRDEYSKEIEDIGCTYVNITIDNKGSSFINDYKLMKELQSVYTKIKPDFIFHYTIKPNIYGSLAAHRAGFPSIAVITGLGYTFINDGPVAKIAKVLYKNTLKYSRKVWFINLEDKNKFLLQNLINPEKIDLIPSEGVDTDRYFPMKVKKDKDKFVFILIARMLWDKGVGEYVEAAKEIKKKYQNVEFQLLGFTDVANPKAISREQIERWVSLGYVNYLGPTDDVRSYIAAADSIVLPSYREGISMILMESASMEKPIITTNVPGCRDLVNNNVSGYLCKTQDSSDLANAMDKMLQLSKDELKQMGVNARKYMLSEFDEKIVIKKYFHELEEICQNNVNKFRLKTQKQTNKSSS